MNESDRELLIWAAKAARIESSIGLLPKDGVSIIQPNGKKWNPLTDNGQAFELAVMCGISVLQFPTCIGTRWPQSGINPPYEEISSGQDHLVATRRVIVRAAAEIGRNMK